MKYGCTKYLNGSKNVGWNANCQLTPKFTKLKNKQNGKKEKSKLTRD